MAEYGEIIFPHYEYSNTLKHVHSKVTLETFSMRSMFQPQACSCVSNYETQYYSPASKEEELYSQLRQEKIKAIPKDEIE